LKVPFPVASHHLAPGKRSRQPFALLFTTPFPSNLFFFFAPDGQEGKKGCRVNRSYLFFFKLSFLGGTAAPSYSSAVAFFRLFFFGFGFAVESAFGQLHPVRTSKDIQLVLPFFFFSSTYISLTVCAIRSCVL